MNGFLAIVVLGLVAAAVGYDFNDEIYNQMIKQDLDDIESLLDAPDYTNVHRRKREESSDKECKKRHMKMCCGGEIIEKIMEKNREMKKECFKEVMAKGKEEQPTTGVYDPFSCEKIQKVKKEWTCVVECVGKKKGTIGEDSSFNEEKVLEIYKKELGGEEWFYKLVEAAYPKCLEHAKSTPFVKDAADPLSCNPMPIRMHFCMWKELQLTCPDDKITDQKMCGKIREKIKKNDFLPFRHHHHDDD